jgi:DNA polymerase III subunit delta
MKLPVHQLTTHVKQPLAPLYLISGDVPLLVQEANDQLRQAAIHQGYTDRQILTLDTGFSWQQLHDTTHHLSLFSTQRLFELRLTTSKLGGGGDAGNKALEAYANQPPADVILIIVMPKLESATQSTRWFKAFDKNGVIIQIWPVDAIQMPRWITQRLKDAGLHTSPEGVALLADSCAGNLLAAAQAIEKLRLLFTPDNSGKPSKVEITDIANIISDNGQFDVFQWVDTVLQGQQPQQVIRMLDTLRACGVEPILILWALVRDLHQLTHMAHEITQGKNISQALQATGVWEKRKPLFTRQLQQHKLSDWQQLLQRAAQVDRMIKGIESGNIWDSLQQIALDICAGSSRVSHPLKQFILA